jgi:hypothetical protein
MMIVVFVMVITPVVQTVLESQMVLLMKIIVVHVMQMHLMTVYRAVMEIGAVVL